MPWYRTGTVAITAGQTTVTGSGTAFALNARVGDAFQGPDGRWYEVTNIASATVLSILPAYQGATVSGGAYGLAPMQGYVKESADRLRQLVDQFGATLSLFGGATTVESLLQNISAATRGANNDITSLSGLTTALSVAQGGTGGKTQAAARTGLGLGAAAVAAILGTVSQSSGVPTGAIMETGANANGTYFKFANGCLICYATGLSLAFANNSNLNSPWTFPSPFSQAPAVFPQLDLTNYTAKIYGTTKEVYQRNTAPSGTTIGVASAGAWVSGDQSLVTISAVAIGRWF